jgi:uncharacterized protein YjiS (DUF1127 family)
MHFLHCGNAEPALVKFGGEGYIRDNEEINTDKRNFIMATYQNSTTQPLGAVTIFRATNILENVVGKAIAWNQARITKNELSKLTARELADIGLTRGDIHNF